MEYPALIPIRKFIFIGGNHRGNRMVEVYEPRLVNYDPDYGRIPLLKKDEDTCADPHQEIHEAETPA